MVLSSAWFLEASSTFWEQRKNSGEEKLPPSPPFIPTLQDPRPAYPFSVVLPLATLTRRNDTFLSLIKPTFTDTGCTNTWNYTDTHPRYTLTNQLTQRNTCNTLVPRDTFNNTNVPTDTNTRACEGACVHTHTHTPHTHTHTHTHTSTQRHSDRHTRINTGSQNSRSWGARVRAP